jgi:hypothetical protein
MDSSVKTRQEKKGRRYKEPYNQKSIRIQESIREKKKEKGKPLITPSTTGFVPS